MCIGWFRKPSPEVQAVLDALESHPDQWVDRIGNGCVLSFPEKGLHVWTGNGDYGVSLWTGAREDYKGLTYKPRGFERHMIFRAVNALAGRRVLKALAEATSGRDAV